VFSVPSVLKKEHREHREHRGRILSFLAGITGDSEGYLYYRKVTTQDEEGMCVDEGPHHPIQHDHCSLYILSWF
jgi:hypothetical protein